MHSHRCEGFERFRLYVSQDGSQPDLTDIASAYANLTLMHRAREPLLSPTQGGTAYLAQHYKWSAPARTRTPLHCTAPPPLQC